MWKTMMRCVHSGQHGGWSQVLNGVRRLGVLLVVIALALPAGSSPVVAGQKGKKNYDAGQKLEDQGKFDLAAEKYMLALSEADRPEYRIAYRRAALQASLMLTRRGREFMEQGQYDDAYNAFRRAYQIDRTNELADVLAKRALRMVSKSGGDSSVPGSSTFGSPGPPDLQSGRAKGTEPGGAASEQPKEAKQDIIFHDQLKAVITQLSRQLGLNVAFDQTVTDKKIDIELKNVTKAQALDIILMSYQLFFEPMGENSIIVAQENPGNRNRLQKMSVKTFYLRNIDGQQLQQLPQQLSLIFGQRIQTMPVIEMRAIIVRTAPENMQLVSDIIESIDKEKAQVMIDVSIYEVSKSDMLQLGNQLLYNGFFQTAPTGPLVPSGLDQIAVTAGQLITQQRLALAVPSSIIQMLQQRGNSRLLDSIQVHALDGEQVTANIGQQIPIQTASYATSLTSVVTGTQQPGTGTNAAANNIFGGLGVPQIDYKNVGLNITVKPTIYGDEDVKLEMQVESSGFSAGPYQLTPIITQRSLKSVATVRTGQAAMMAGVAQRRNDTSRTSLPILGFLPVVGRLFSVPKDTSSTTDILITVTPQIIRAPTIEDKDRLTRLAGTLQAQGATETIEEFVDHMRAQEAQRQGPDVAKGKGEGDKGGAPALNAKTTEPATTGAQKEQTGPPADATQAVATPTIEGEPINVSLQINPTTPRAGEWVQVAVFLNGNVDIKEGAVTVTFDPKFLRLTNVADGGLLTTTDSRGEVTGQPDVNGRVVINAKIGPGGQPRPARGKLAVLLFNVVMAGSSQLNVEAATSTFLTGDGKTVGCHAVPMTVAAR